MAGAGSEALRASASIIVGRLMQQPKGREIYHHRLVAAMSTVPLSDIDTLTQHFDAFYERSEFNDLYRDRMNMQGIVTLERLANLDRRTVTILCDRDEVGMLREILRPFGRARQSISPPSTPICWPVLKFRFDIGYDFRCI